MSAYRPLTRVVFASAARTATATSDKIIVPAGYCGIRVYISLTVGTSVQVTPSIQIDDPVSGNKVDLLAAAQITAGASTPVLLYVAPGSATTSNRAIGEHIGRQFYIKMTHGNSTSATYSVAVEFIPACGC